MVSITKDKRAICEEKIVAHSICSEKGGKQNVSFHFFSSDWFVTQPTDAIHSPSQSEFLHPPRVRKVPWNMRTSIRRLQFETFTTENRLNFRVLRLSIRDNAVEGEFVEREASDVQTNISSQECAQSPPWLLRKVCPVSKSTSPREQNQ